LAEATRQNLVCGERQLHRGSDAVSAAPQLAQSLGATGSVGKGWETALEGIALAAEAALADARLLKAKQAAGGGAEEGPLLEALKTLILDLQRCEGAAFDKVLQAHRSSIESIDCPHLRVCDYMQAFLESNIRDLN
jgi:hypothetical protein